jgi:hypothetical protein
MQTQSWTAIPISVLLDPSTTCTGMSALTCPLEVSNSGGTSFPHDVTPQMGHGGFNRRPSAVLTITATRGGAAMPTTLAFDIEPG